MPELMNTWTSGTDTIRAAIADQIVYPETLNASPMPPISSFGMHHVIMAMTINAPPGIISGVKLYSIPVPRISSKATDQAESNAFRPSASILVTTRSSATRTYGSHALNMEMSFGALASLFISLIQDLSQLSRGSKSKVSFG